MKQMLISNAYWQLQTFISNDPLSQNLLLRKLNPPIFCCDIFVLSLLIKKNIIEKK